MKLLTHLVITIAALSLFCALTDPWFLTYFRVMSLSDWLGLSLTGLHNLYLWQLVSWIFVEPSYGAGISFSYLINLTFSLYILWIFGSSFIECFGENRFVRFFGASTLFFGLLSSLIILLSGTYSMLMGITPFLISLFTVWALMNSENNVLVMFVLPIKTKVLLALIAGGTFLMALSQGSLLFFVLYPGAVIWGYLYAIFFLELWSPFPYLNPLENWLHNLRGRWQKGKTVVEDASKKIKGKVIDLHTGKPHLDDEEFLNEMLDKIAKQGEDSLSWSELRRLNEISKNKRGE